MPKEENEEPKLASTIIAVKTETRYFQIADLLGKPTISRLQKTLKALIAVNSILEDWSDDVCNRQKFKRKAAALSEFN